MVDIAFLLASRVFRTPNAEGRGFVPPPLLSPGRFACYLFSRFLPIPTRLQQPAAEHTSAPGMGTVAVAFVRRRRSLSLECVSAEEAWFPPTR